MDRLGHTTPKAALVCQHAAADRDRLIAECLSGRLSTPATWSQHAGDYTVAWSPEALTGSPELVNAIRAMVEHRERVLVTPAGPTLTTQMGEPLSSLVTCQVLRGLGVSDAIETEGHTPAYPSLPLGSVG